MPRYLSGGGVIEPELVQFLAERSNDTAPGFAERFAQGLI